MSDAPRDHAPRAERSPSAGEGAETALAASDRPGSGYAIEREAASLADAWRSRLSPAQAAEIAAVLAAFPLA